MRILLLGDETGPGALLLLGRSVIQDRLIESDLIDRIVEKLGVGEQVQVGLEIVGIASGEGVIRLGADDVEFSNVL